MTTLNMYVFILAFAAAFLLGGKRPFLQLSTRVTLVVLLALAVSYAMTGETVWYRGIVAGATLIANIVFVLFAGIDYLNWQKKSRAAD